MEKRILTRKDFLRYSAMTAVGTLLAACAVPTPVVHTVEVPVTREVTKPVTQVVTKEVTVPVTKEVTVPVTKVVTQEVTKVVTQVVTKEVIKGGYPVPRADTVIINETATQRIFDSANPFIPNAMIGGWNQVGAARLMYLNWASGEDVYDLVTAYEYNKDFTKCTFKVRKEAKWNDGKPFTAQDIAFTVNMVKADPSLSWGTLMQRWVDKIDTPDDYTIIFTTLKPNPRFHWYFKQAWSMPIVAKHIWEKQDPKTFKAFPPVGTGPYKWYMAVPELRMLVFERDDNYWGKALGREAGPKYYIYQTGPPADAEIADLADNFIDHAHSYTSDAKLLKRSQELNKEVVLAPWRDPCPRGIWFNCAKYPLSLPEVRWAFFHCIDKEKAAKSLYPWPTVPALYPWSDWGSHDKYAYADVLKEFDTSFNVELAGKMLDNLGFKKGPDGIRVDGKGNKMSYTIQVPEQAVTGEYPIAVDFAENLGKIGVQAAVKWMSSTVMFDNYAMGNFDITSHWWCGNWQEPPVSFSAFKGDYVKPIGERATAGNDCRWKDPELDKVTDQIDVMSPDDPAIVPLYKQAFRLYMKDMPSVPVVQTTYVMPFTTHYWKGWPQEGKIDVVPFTWWCEFMFVLFKLKKA